MDQEVTQKKFETFLSRLSQSCLGLCAILFLVQICLASIGSYGASTFVTGFGFTLFLFIIWHSVNHAYGRSEKKVKILKWTQNQPLKGP